MSLRLPMSSLVRIGAAISAIFAVGVTLLAAPVATAAQLLPRASALDNVSGNLELHYDFADPIDDGLVSDLSGNGFDGTIVGTGLTIVDGGLDMSGNGHVTIPGEVFEGNNSLTISAWLRNDMVADDYAALYFGKADTAPSQYWLLNPKNPAGRYKSVITNGFSTGAPWDTESGITPTQAARGIQGPTTTADLALYTTVITATSITGYLNGVKIGTVPVTRTITDFGTDLVAYIGNSPYSVWGDPRWNGLITDLKVYSAAITDQQAAAQYFEELGNDTATDAALAQDAAALSISSPVASNIVLPGSGANGSSITWASSNPAIIAADGTFTAPTTADEDVTLTATLALAGRTTTRVFELRATSNAAATLLAHYDFSDSISDGIISDVSGKGNNATVTGAGASVNNTDGYLTLPGGASNSGAAYVTLPRGMFDGKNTLTISTWLRNRTGSGNYAAMFFGTTQSSPLQYWLLNPANTAGRMKSVIVDGNPTSSPWSLESGISPTNSSRGVTGPVTGSEWGMYTTVITPTSITGYYNGALVGTVATTRTVSQFGTNLVAYIGRSSYADKFYNGDVRDVRIYTSAWSATQVSNLYYSTVGDTSAIDAALAADAAAITLHGQQVSDNLALPVAGQRGSAIAWTSSAPSVIANNGTVTRPSDTNATVTLTAVLTLAGRSITRDYTVTVLADNPQANIDFAASTYDLGVTHVWENLTLESAFAGYQVSWESSAPAVIDASGVVSRGGLERAVTLTATFTDGTVSSQRTFDLTVLAADTAWIGSGIGSGNTDDTDALRLARSENGSTFSSLNDGQAVLYPELGNRKLGWPTLFRTPQGGFGVVATQDSDSNQIYVFDSDNLYRFSNERLVQFAPAGVRAARVSVDYDHAIRAYRLTYVNLANSIAYEVTTKDFVQFSAPVAIPAAVSAHSATYPGGYIETNALPVTAAEYDAVVERLSRVRSVAVNPFADVVISKADYFTLPETATVTYSNGTTANMPVDWDTSGIDLDLAGTYTINGTVTRPDYNDPLVERRADPDVSIGDDGYYYFTASYPMTRSNDPEGYDRVVLRRAASMNDLGNAQEVTIWDESSVANMNSYIWAPELVKIDGHWYVLFTAARTSGYDIRPAVLKFTGSSLSGAEAMNPANWVTVGYNQAAAGDSVAFSRFSLDMTHFEHNGVDYAIWAQADAEGYSTLRMAPMDSSNPQNMAAPSIEIAKPTRAWEQSSNVKVNEGPAVIKRDGKIIVAFSSAFVDAAYNISVLWADQNADLMDPASWKKLGYPLLTTDDVPGDFGPGHNSFTVDEWGNPIMVFHSRTYGDTSLPGETTDGGLFDPRRHARAKMVHFDVDGLPILDMTPTEELDPAIANVSIRVTVEPDEGLVVHYPLDETSGTVAADASGNGRNATYVGGPSLGGDAGVSLDGVNDYVDLPDNILAGLNSATISVDALVQQSQSGNYFIVGLGNPATSNSGSGYWMLTGNSRYRGTITSGNWAQEQNATSASALQRGVWKTLTYTIDDATDTARLYLDGVEVAVSTTTTHKPGALGNGVTTDNAIGKSNYAADRLLTGMVRDFRLYDYALSAAEVQALVPNDSQRFARDLAALTLGDTSAVTGNLPLITTGINSSTISWTSSKPSVIATDGTVTRPGYAAGDATVVLTATVTRGAYSATKEFTVVVKATADDQAIADAAAAALSVTNIDDVRGNLTLPSEINGLPVTWASSNSSVVGTDGVVNRQSADTQVTLTATITKGGATAVREFTAQVRAAIELAPFEGYAFSYFTGNSIQGEKIYFAASDGNDALNWDELNGGDPILESTYGEMGLRDPFLIRSPEGDTFYLIATDLSIGRNPDWDRSQRSGSLYLEIWESHDLVNWSEQRHVKVSPDNAGNTWAPEAYYDESIGAYVVFWASKLFPESDPGHTSSVSNSMVFSITRDFVTFTEPQLWQSGISRIDSTVIEVDGIYHRFTKDEGAGTTGCSDIIQEKSANLRATLEGWDFVDSCIGKGAGTSAVEGPSIFKSNPGDVNGDYYYLFVDEYGGRGYIPLRTADINNPDWKVAPRYDLPGSPRHGTVIPVTATELANLRALIDQAPAVSANANGEVLRYDFTTGSGTQVSDVSGNGYHGTIVGDARAASGELVFTGNDYVDLPDNILSGIEDITIEAEVYLDSSLTGNYFIYGLGNTDGQGVGNGYLFATGNAQYRTSIATGNWSTEQSVRSSSALPRNQWVTLTYTIKGNTATLYLNGLQVATSTVTTDPTDIGNTFTTANYLGKSNYNADGLFKGRYREFAIYNRALSATEVLDNSGRDDVLLDVSLADDSVLALDPIVDYDDHTVVFPVEPGTDLEALAPVFTTVAGVTASPASGTVRDLSSPVTYQLAGDSTVVWTMSAVEMRSPILPGLYADPNVFAHGDTYYIYATTDGFSGWGGKEFYVWSSKDLVNWTRSADPILTLDGANGDVPWASGNAWAPTIIEKDGKFYFYFSGHNAALNRKTIGVAVADSPTGPFVAQPNAMILNNEAVTSGQAIDPAAFKDPVSGEYYLFWGNGSPVYAKLADDMVSLVPGSIKAITGLTNFREGLFPVYRDGLYHMTYSIDDTGSENYRVGYATATSIAGPWTYRGVILEKDLDLGIKGPGHNSILNVPGTDDWYIVYHRFAMPGGNGTNRETTIDRLSFDPQTGLIQKVTPTLSAVQAQEIEDQEPLEVTISGDLEVGETLTASASSPWLVTSIQWLLDGQEIDGATTDELQLISAYSGSELSVRVTGEKPWWPESTVTSQVVELPEFVDQEPLEVTISGDLEVGETLTATASSPWLVTSIQWLLDGQEIDGATTDELQLISAYSGSELSVRVTGEKPWWPESTVTSQVVELPEFVDQEPLEVTISGEVKVGKVLTANVNSPWTADSYQWLRDGQVIQGATASQLVLVATDAETDISVRVTASKPLWEPSTVTSASVAVPPIEVNSGENEGDLAVSATTARPGDKITIWGEGFAPGETVEVTLYSEPKSLGRFTASTAGTLTAVVTIPLGTEAGQHTIEAVGLDSGLALEAGIRVVAADTLVFTGVSDQLRLLLIVAATLILLGGVALTVRRAARS